MPALGGSGLGGVACSRGGGGLVPGERCLLPEGGSGPGVPGPGGCLFPGGVPGPGGCGDFPHETAAAAGGTHPTGMHSC